MGEHTITARLIEDAIQKVKTDMAVGLGTERTSRRVAVMELDRRITRLEQREDAADMEKLRRSLQAIYDMWVGCPEDDYSRGLRNGLSTALEAIDGL